MKYELHYKRSFLKNLKKIPKSYQLKIIKKIELLSDNPNAGKALSGVFQGKYSLRVWPYRVVYTLDGKTIYLNNVGHRQGIYK